MKNYLPLLFLVAIFVAISFGHTALQNPSTDLIDPLRAPNASLTVEAADEQPSPGMPVQVTVPHIGLRAIIIAAGVDVDGRPWVPGDNQSASWWQHGARPGEVGSAVFAGHYLLEGGKPGVFYKLNQIAEGDEIEVLDEKGATKQFIAKEIKVYSESEFPLQDVYQRMDGRWLILVTCAGRYESQRQDYSHRLVVFAELQE